MINELISLEEKSETEKINKDIYISYIKYIFSLIKLFLKNDQISSEESELLKSKFKNIFLLVQFINDSILFELLEDIQDNNSIYQY